MSSPFVDQSGRPASDRATPESSPTEPVPSGPDIQSRFDAELRWRLRVAAHELRAPLEAIRLAADLLDRSSGRQRREAPRSGHTAADAAETSDAAAHRIDHDSELLEVIQRQVDHAGELVAAMVTGSGFDFAAASDADVDEQSGRGVAATDLAAVLSALVDDLSPLATERAVTLVELVSRRPIVRQNDADADAASAAGKAAAEAMRVAISPRSLRQVVTNLVVNAIDASAIGQTVLIEPLPSEASGERERSPQSASQTDLPSIGFVVRDFGRGLTSEELAILRDPATESTGEEERASADRAETDTRFSAGWGVGLPLVRRLLRDVGGELTIHSGGPQEGCAMAVRLRPAALVRPAPTTGATAAPPDEAAAETSLHGRPLEGCSVLLLEDDDEVARLMQEGLMLFGADVTLVGTVAAARDALSTTRLADPPAGADPRTSSRPERSVGSTASARRFDVALFDETLPDGRGSDLAKALADSNDDRRPERSARRPALVSLSGCSNAAAAFDPFDARVVKPVDLDQLVTLIRRIVSP